jgi:hypothetical protein
LGRHAGQGPFLILCLVFLLFSFLSKNADIATIVVVAMVFLYKRTPAMTALSL